MALTAALLISLTDKLTAWYLAELGTAATGYGMGATADLSTRAYGKATDYLALVRDSGNTAVVQNLISSAVLFQSLTDGNSLAQALAGPALSALHALCGNAGISGVTGIDSFATYYNTGAGGPWNALLAPDFRTLYSACTILPSLNTTAPNCYAEIKQGATYANALGKFVASGAAAGSYTAPSAVDSLLVAHYDQLSGAPGMDSTLYAGGYPYVQWSGGTGSETLTITGIWRKTDGTLASGAATYTTAAASSATPGSLIASGNRPFANSLLITTTNITITGSQNGATFYLNAIKPAGRANPPT